MKKLIIMTEEKFKAILRDNREEAEEAVRQDYQRELLLKQADIATLQGQINPHFLYNALECIRGQALYDGSDAVAEITHALSRFFRYSISTKGDTVTLKDELDNVGSYMTIQQYRFQGRFKFRTSYDDKDKEILDTILPNLTLQPIVENAMQHAFADMAEGAEIEIRITRTQKHLEITVSDNGAGMDYDRLELLRNRINGLQDSRPLGDQRHTGIALQNVNSRLKLCFGEHYGITVDSRAGEGTDIHLFVPFRPLGQEISSR